MEKLQYDCDEYILYSPDSLKYITDNMNESLKEKINFYKDLFDTKDYRKIQINYFDDLDKLRNYIYEIRGEKESLPEYAKGTFDKGMVNAFIPNNIIINSQKYIRNLNMASHEIFHIMYKELILEKNNMNRITWFDEGMAQYFSGEFDYIKEENEFKKSFEFIKNNTKVIPNMNELKHGSSFQTDDYNGYYLSYLSVKYLFETLSKDEFKELMKNEEKIKEYGNNIVQTMFDYYENKYNKVFESEHINYVKMNEKYLNDYLNMYNNKEMQKVLFGKEKEFSKDQIINWINKVKENNLYTYTMIEKETNDFIGTIEIMNINDDSGEIAITITPDKQGNHYGKEAMNAIVKYGYKNIGLKNIDVNVHKSNLRAIHLYENTGFIQDEENDESIHMRHIK